MQLGRLVAAGSALALAAPASAGITNLTPNTFISSHVLVFPGMSAGHAYRSFIALPRWWDPAHSYSGKSSALRFSAVAGSCWCESLEDGGSIEHMRVQLVQPGKRLVMSGGLGPLLFQGVAGTMDVTFTQKGKDTTVTIDYRVAGFARSDADKNAAPVDRVLAAAAERYAAYARSSVTKAKAGVSSPAG